MSEFVEVMRQARRMCEEHFAKNAEDDCSESCPLYTGWCPGLDDGRAICFTPKEETMKRVEAIVMDWAEAHPEPVYPTWGEYLRGRGIVPKCYCDGCYLDGVRMDAGTAEALGVEQVVEE